MSSIRAPDKESTEPIGLAQWAKEKLLSQNRTQKCHAFDTGTSLPKGTLPMSPQLEQRCSNYDSQKSDALEGEKSENNVSEDANGDEQENATMSPVAVQSALSALSALTLDTEGKRSGEERETTNTKKPRGEGGEPAANLSIDTLSGKLQHVLALGGLRFVYVHCRPPAKVHYLVAIDNPRDVTADAPPMTAHLPEENVFETRFWKGSCLSTNAIQELLESNGFVKMTNFTLMFPSKHLDQKAKCWTISIKSAEERKFYDSKLHTAWIEETVIDIGMSNGEKGPLAVSLTFSEPMGEDGRAIMNEFQEAIQNSACIRSAERLAWLASMGEENPAHVDFGLVIPPSMGFDLENVLGDVLNVDGFEQIVNDMSLPLPPPVPDSYLAADAQRASLTRRSEEPTPRVDEFDTFMDWHLSNTYTSWEDDMLSTRSQKHFESTFPLKPRSLRANNDFYITKTKAWEENSVPGQWYNADEQNGFILTDIVKKEETWFGQSYMGRTLRWGVQADDANFNGFFNHAALQKIYHKMIAKGRVMFSVLDGTPDKPGKAIQFFPQKYVCSSVPWWSSKLDYLPLTLRFESVGSGSYNTVERLHNHANVVAFSVIVEGPIGNPLHAWDAIKRRVITAQKKKIKEMQKNDLKFLGVKFVDAQVIMQTSHLTLAYKPVTNAASQKLVEELTRELSRPAGWVGMRVIKVSDPPRVLFAPDVRFFLPDFRLAYGLEKTDPRVKEIHDDANKWGLIRRTAYFDGKSKDPIERPLREAMLSSLAAANGFGPRIFAQWIVPEDAGNYQMFMNTSEPCAHFADGVLEVNRLDATDSKFNKNCIPSDAWCEDSNWTLRSAQIPRALKMPDLRTKALQQRLGWRSTCTLMEGFEGDVSKLDMKSDSQYSLFVDAVYEQCERMGQAGVLHGDIKIENSVYRTLKTDDAQPDWDNIHVRLIDFDPYFCKLVPFVPTEVLTLINFAMYMTSAACRRPRWKLSAFALKKVNYLIKRVSDMYNENESPFAIAFLALGPTYRRYKLPVTMVEADGYEALPPNRLPGEYILYNDEWEAARMFRYNVAHYFEDGCGGAYKNKEINDKGVPMIARMLSFIAQRNQKVAPRYADLVQDGKGDFPDGKASASYELSESESESESESDSGS